MSLCKDCISGVTHEGTPQGKWEEIGGVKSYVATPTIDYQKEKIVLFLPDVFGAQLSNAQLLADDFARNGLRTVIPDYLGGDPIPKDALSPGATFDLMGWLGKHGQSVTRPHIDKVVAALKAQGVTTFAATGYCFGGRYVFDLAIDNVLKVAATSHPSLLQIPADLENYVAKSKAPLLINSCTVDTQFPPEAGDIADKIFAKFGPGYKRDYYEGCTHGFAVRGDLTDPAVKAGKEGSFKGTVEWFLKYL